MIESLGEMLEGVYSKPHLRKDLPFTLSKKIKSKPEAVSTSQVENSYTGPDEESCAYFDEWCPKWEKDPISFWTCREKVQDTDLAHFSGCELARLVETYMATQRVVV